MSITTSALISAKFEELIIVIDLDYDDINGQ